MNGGYEPQNQEQYIVNQNPQQDNMKYCKYCGSKIPMDAVICTACGRQVEVLQQMPPQYVAVPVGRVPVARNKWAAFLLCFFLGGLGAHKFYELKPGMGVLYILTLGLFGIGWLVDLIVILCKPNPYYV